MLYKNSIIILIFREKKNEQFFELHVTKKKGWVKKRGRSINHENGLHIDGSDWQDSSETKFQVLSQEPMKRKFDFSHVTLKKSLGDRSQNDKSNICKTHFKNISTYNWHHIPEDNLYTIVKYEKSKPQL